MLLYLILFNLILVYGVYGYRIMSPISNFYMEQQKNGGTRFENTDNLRHHLHDVVKYAFNDAINQSVDDGIDYYSRGVAESDQTIMLLGERISGVGASNLCGSLADKQFFHIPPAYRDGIHFIPSRPIPIPVVNLTMHIPSRWFSEPDQKSPLIYICYEGDTFLKLLAVETKPGDWQESADFRKTLISNFYNERCRIREVLVVLDDFWNNRYLLPRHLEARLIMETKSFLPRITFVKECNETLGTEQPCCLWKFHFTDIDGDLREFRRCFGSIPIEALKSTQIPEALADLLVRGRMTRRFLTPPTRVCREIEFAPMVVRKPDGKLMAMNRLDAVRCAAFY